MATVPNIIANLAAGAQPASLLDANWAACCVGANNLSDVTNAAQALANIGGQSQTAVATWTPADASGASLSFSNVDAAYQQVGNFVHAYFSLQYPVTADGSFALIGGLPTTILNSNRGNVAAMIQNNNPGAFGLYIVAVKNSKTFTVWNAATANRATNAGISNLTLSGMLIYPVL